MYCKYCIIDYGHTKLRHCVRCTARLIETTEVKEFTTSPKHPDSIKEENK